MYYNVLEKAVKRVKERKKAHLCPSGRFCFEAQCDCGHKFLKYHSCNKEVCEVCGSVGSSLHRQRIMRWLKKVLYMLREKGSVGYMVITLPKDFWDVDKITPKFLMRFRTYVRRKLKRMGFDIGKMRYHWAGDRGKCFYPHLNILMGFAYIREGDLEKLKVDIAKWLKIKGKVVLEYRYSNDLKKIIHWVKYVTRPTLMLIKNDNERVKAWYYVVENFRNDVEWGKPKEVGLEEVVGYEDVKDYLCEDDKMYYDLIKGRCPYCGAKLRWRYVKGRHPPDVKRSWGEFIEI